MSIQPTKRQGNLKKANYHIGHVCCVLFGKFSDSKKTREIGVAKHQNFNFSDLEYHAEQQWWNDISNVDALEEALASETLERLEFEVTTEFCDREPNIGKKTCMERFKRARVRPLRQVPIYIFIQKSRRCYEVTHTGEVVFLCEW